MKDWRDADTYGTVLILFLKKLNLICQALFIH